MFFQHGLDRLEKHCLLEIAFSLPTLSGALNLSVLIAGKENLLLAFSPMATLSLEIQFKIVFLLPFTGLTVLCKTKMYGFLVKS